MPDNPCGGKVEGGEGGADGPSVSGLGPDGCAATFLTYFAVNATPAEPPLRCCVAGGCLTSAPVVERRVPRSGSRQVRSCCSSPAWRAFYVVGPDGGKLTDVWLRDRMRDEVARALTWPLTSFLQRGRAGRQ